MFAKKRLRGEPRRAPSRLSVPFSLVHLGFLRRGRGRGAAGGLHRAGRRGFLGGHPARCRRGRRGSQLVPLPVRGHLDLADGVVSPAPSPVTCERPGQYALARSEQTLLRNGQPQSHQLYAQPHTNPIDSRHAFLSFLSFFLRSFCPLALDACDDTTNS